MPANATFSLPRFLQMTRAHITEKKRKYFWFFAIIAMIYFLFLLILTTEEKITYRTEAQIFFYYAGLLTTGYIFALRYFSNMARPESALLELMQPVSAFEKWILAIITIIFIYPIIYTIIFLAMTYPVQYLSFADHNYSLRYQLFIPLSNIITNEYTGNQLKMIEQIPAWIMYFAICGYAVVTSLMFKKLPMIKSFALGFCLLLFFLTIIVNTNKGNVQIFLVWFVEYYHSNSFTAIISNLLLWVIAPTLLWAASFWALKERDLS